MVKGEALSFLTGHFFANEFKNFELAITRMKYPV